jgi:L-ribulose-5-phosphate 4-epimerase
MSSLGKARGAYAELKEEVYLANLEIPRRGLAIYTFGNVSGLDAARSVFAIKPSGVPYEELAANDIVILDLDGKKVEGAMNPSSDAPTHAVLYRSFSNAKHPGGIGGIVHTHSTYATAWAQARREIPVYGTTHADHLAREVPCTAPLSELSVRGDYEAQTGERILKTFEEKGLSPLEIPMVLVAGHGPFTWGKDPAKAVYNAAVLEEISRMAMLTERISPQAPVLEDYVIRKHFERKHGPSAYYGQASGNKEERK